MSVGIQSSNSQLDNLMTQLTRQLRDLCATIGNLNAQVNGQANGTSYLETAGYAAADAATFLTYLGYLNTFAEIFEGSGTQATAFDFANALAPLYGGG